MAKIFFKSMNNISRSLAFAWLISAVLALAPVSASAITLEQFLARIKSTHPTMKKETTEPEADSMGAGRKGGGDAWLLRISPRAKHTETSIVQPGLPETSTTYGTETSLEKTIESTGTKLKFMASTEYVDQTYGQTFVLNQNGPNGGAGQTMQQQGPQGPRPNQQPAGGGGGGQSLLLNPGGQYRTGVGINVTQPLLGGSGGGKEKAQSRGPARDGKSAAAQTAESQSAFMLEMAERFVDWALAEEKEQIARQRLKTEEEQQALLAAKKKDGGAAELDALRAHTAALAAKRSLALAEMGKKAARAELAAQSQNEKMNEESAQMDLYKKSAVPPAAEATESAVKNSKILAALYESRERYPADDNSAGGGGGARLDMNLGAGVKGEDKEYGKSLNMDRQEWSASLVFSYPFGGKSGSAEGGKAGGQTARLDNQIAAAKLKLSAQARMLATATSEMDKALTISHEQAVAAGEIADGEERAYAQGKSDFAKTVLARDALERARTAHAENAAARAKLKLRLDAAMERLF